MHNIADQLQTCLQHFFSTRQKYIKIVRFESILLTFSIPENIFKHKKKLVKSLPIHRFSVKSYTTYNWFNYSKNQSQQLYAVRCDHSLVLYGKIKLYTNAYKTEFTEKISSMWYMRKKDMQLISYMISLKDDLTLQSSHVILLFEFKRHCLLCV